MGSRSSTPKPHKQNSGDPDSGFGMEDVGSDSLESRNLSRILPSHESHSSHLSVASDSDYSVSSRSNLSDVDDTTEMNYFKNVARDLNSNSPVVSTL